MLQVNGRDVREHADALRAFETAPEPIVVEVRRTGLSGSLISTAVQTETPIAGICDQDEDDEDELEFILDDAFDYEVKFPQEYLLLLKTKKCTF